MSVLRMAVIGVGALGRHHARIVSQIPGVELVAVADSSECKDDKLPSPQGRNGSPTIARSLTMSMQ